MRNHTLNKDKQLPVVYFQKLYIVPFGFLPYYKCISMCFKDVDIILSVFNQLELTNSFNFRMLSPPYDSL